MRVITNTMLPPRSAAELDELAGILDRRHGVRLGRNFALRAAIMGEVERRQAGDVPAMDGYEPHPNPTIVRVKLTPETIAWLDWLAAQDCRQLGRAKHNRVPSFIVAIRRELAATRKALASSKKSPVPT